jgi:hypothetical protein
MCCFYTILVFLGPRVAMLVWWLMDPGRWGLAFNNSFLWPILGFLFLPWTTLMFVLVFPISGFGWMWLFLALMADLSMYGGGAYGNRGAMRRA